MRLILAAFLHPVYDRIYKGQDNPAYSVVTAA